MMNLTSDVMMTCYLNAMYSHLLKIKRIFSLTNSFAHKGRARWIQRVIRIESQFIPHFPKITRIQSNCIRIFSLWIAEHKIPPSQRSKPILQTIRINPLLLSQKIFSWIANYLYLVTCLRLANQNGGNNPPRSQLFNLYIRPSLSSN